MSATVASNIELEMYVNELWAFLERFEQALKQKRLDDLRQSCRMLMDRLPTLPASDERLSQRFAAMRLRLEELRTALETASQSHWQQSQQYLKRRHLELSRSYEHWVLAWRAFVAQHKIEMPKAQGLRPLIHARTIFHVFMAVVAVVCYQFFLTRMGAVIVLGSLLSVFGSLEITRRIWPRWNDILLESPMFKRIARPHEYHRVNSATYYLIALLLVTPFFSRPEVIVGILVLGFADPAAAWIGKRYGKRKLFGEKTLLGSLAFVAAGFIVSASFLLAFYPELPLEQRLLGAFAAAFIGGLVELVVNRIDDNLAIPLAAVTAASFFF